MTVRGYWIGVVLVAIWLVGLAGVAQERSAALSDAVQQKARIVQLESALAKAQADSAVCTARLALVGQQQQETATKAAMAQLEKDAGCVLDYSANPVVCKVPD